MPKRPTPIRPKTRKSDEIAERLASPAIVPKAADPRQAALFDQPLPRWIKPCLPTLVSKPPVGEFWVHEVKWDGYRVSAYIQNGKSVIRTRNGYDWTSRFPTIAAASMTLKASSRSGSIATIW